MQLAILPLTFGHAAVFVDHLAEDEFAFLKYPLFYHTILFRYLAFAEAAILELTFKDSARWHYDRAFLEESQLILLPKSINFETVLIGIGAITVRVSLSPLPSEAD